MSLPLPATTVTTIDAQAAISAALDSTQAFVIGETYRGPVDAPVAITSPRDLQRKFERTGVGIPVYDAVDVMLREGVPRVWVMRLVGAAAVRASATFNGTGSGGSIIVTAIEPGEWANGAAGGLSADVDVGDSAGERVLNVYRDAVLVETSGSQATRAGLVGFGDTSKYVTVALGPDTTMPAATGSPTNLTGGDAALAGIDDTALGAAAALMPADLGPGQVIAPGRTTLGSNTAILQHCADFNRTPLLEVAEGVDKATILSLAASLRALGSGAEGLPRLGGLWAQHAVGPGVVPGTTRTVPWGCVVAGLIARAERAEGHPNVDPSGDMGVPLWATDADVYYTQADAEDLYEAGVNIVETYRGVPRNATFHTLEDPGASEWVELAHSRLDRAVRADAFDIGRSIEHKTIDGQGHLFGQFGGRLRDRLAQRWKVGALFGSTADEAFNVDVGPTQNTVESIALREVHAGIGLKMSPHAEQVFVDLAKVPIGGSV